MRIIVSNPNTTATMPSKIGHAAQAVAAPGAEGLCRRLDIAWHWIVQRPYTI